MHVAFIGPWQVKCGVTDYMQALKRQLDAFADMQIVKFSATMSRKGVLELCDQINNADIAHIQYCPDYYGYWRCPKMLFNFMFFIKHIRIPIVITAHDLIHYIPFYKLEELNLKRIFYNTIMVPFVNLTPFGKFMRGRFLDIADRLIVHIGVDKLFLESLNISAHKISLLYPGVPEIEMKSSESVREELGLKSQRLITIFGFIRPCKGYEMAITAMKELPQDVVLIIAGGLRDKGFSSYLEELKMLISSLGLEERVKITGYLDIEKIISILGVSDIILFPYRLITPASYAFSYAIAAKRPIVTSNIDFFREIEEKYSAVRTFECNDYQALVGTIKEELGRYGREPEGVAQYRKDWSWKNVAEKTYGIYCGLLLKKQAANA